MHDFRLLMHPSRITVGRPVWSRGRTRLGIVGAVEGASLRVDLRSGDQYWLPIHWVAFAAPNEAVHLTVERPQVTLQGVRSGDQAVHQQPAMAMDAHRRSA
jgi:hypothetical protein